VEALRAKTPVFTDESGRRVTVLQWVARGLCACLVLVGAAVAIAMVTHVPLPGLGRLAPPTSDSAPGAARDATADGGSALDAGLTAGSNPRAVDGPAARLARSQEATKVARRNAVEESVADAATRALSVATAAPAAQGAAPASGSGSATTPKPQPAATASPTPANNPPSHSSANPRATARSANSTGRATPHATAKTTNPRATAARSNGLSSSASTSTPPGWTK